MGNNVLSEICENVKPVIAEKAKEQQVRKPANFVLQKSVEQKPIDTQKELAKAAGVSHEQSGNSRERCTGAHRSHRSSRRTSNTSNYTAEHTGAKTARFKALGLQADSAENRHGAKSAPQTVKHERTPSKVRRTPDNVNEARKSETAMCNIALTEKTHKNPRAIRRKEKRKKTLDNARL